MVLKAKEPTEDEHDLLPKAELCMEHIQSMQGSKGPSKSGIGTEKALPVTGTQDPDQVDLSSVITQVSPVQHMTLRCYYLVKSSPKDGLRSFRVLSF